MALEIVGGAFLSAVFNVLVEQITPELKSLFETRKMDGRLLEELELLMIAANEVLDDAEHKQITTPAVENSPVKKWLDKLRDAAYEADDLLDLIAYEVTAARIQADRRTTAKQIEKASANYSEGVVSSRDVLKKMEEIVERLGQLMDQIGRLGLRDGGRNEARPQREASTSLVEESEIFGRDDDKDAILKLLEDDDANIRVIPIVGMGGIGKTTLAQLVYNHNTAQDLFEPRAWVCVSDNYDGVRIKKDLLMQLNHSVKCQDLSPEQIDRKIHESLKGKRFLVVLDDIWNESYNDWDKLQTPLMSGKPGSKIIVTTRSEGVASIMGSIESYQLRTLDDDYCWRLFSRRAFNGGSEDPELKAVGEKIVSKCKGLPLAVKMLGDLLRRKRKVTEWEAILSSDIWDLKNDEILPALRLSYWHLPSQLKQCFVYCAIFPKDYKIEKEEMIQLWMAEGILVKPRRGRGRTIEELGENYLQELVSRSFLEQYNDKYSGPCFLMHDLVNDLAQQLSGEFLVKMDGDKCCEFGARNRYFSFMASKVDVSMMLDTIRKAQFLRTFWSDYQNIEVGAELVYDLQSLRVLCLRSFFTMVQLPESIGNLKHLRYLNLEGTEIERLPKTLCSLYNLQSIILYFCDELVELPRDFGNLINLHFLDIRETTKLQELPPNMGNLKDLLTLCKFFVGKENGSHITELGKLQHLQGQLSIYNLENVVGSPKDILKNKERLKELDLIWFGDTEDSLHENNLLEGLQPHTNIEKLSIFGYGGTRFPDWVGQASYSNIVSLKLHECKYCFSFPSLELSSLEDLSISKFDAVVEVCMKIPLNSLKTLHIEDMKQWQEWIFGDENDHVKRGSLAKLEELTIKNCPQLRCISTCGPGHLIFESLNSLMVEGCSLFLNPSNLLATINFKQLVVKNKPPTRSLLAGLDTHNDFDEIPKVILEQLPSAMYLLYIKKLKVERLEEMGSALNALEDVRVGESESVECIPLEVFPALKSLYVTKCDNLNYLSASGKHILHPLTSLTCLEISCCRSLKCLPKGGISAPNLTNLLPSLEKLSIVECKEMESFSEGGLPTKLKSLEIAYCNDKIISEVLQFGLKTLDVLSDLSLGGYEGSDLDSFPEETMLPSSLTSLQLYCFENLKYINCRAIRQVSHLCIRWCPNLQALSSVESFADNETESSLGGGNLQSLLIHECDKLVCSRLQWGMQRFNALSNLILHGYEGDDLDSFPEESLLPSTLTSLAIRNFENLKGLNSKGLQHLTSLSELEIYWCRNLQCLPEHGIPSSLSLLSIVECALLEERCKRDIGEDWPKIFHITTIEINLNTI